MGMPRKIVNFNVFDEDRNYRGEASEVQLPDMERKMEAVQLGGIDGEVEQDMGGGGALVVNHKYASYVPEFLKKFGAARAAAHYVRFVAVVQNDETGEYGELEVIVRGRHKKIGRGGWKVGDASETSVETTCVYYRESFNGSVITEIDKLNFIHIVDGVDILAEQRAILQIG